MEIKVIACQEPDSEEPVVFEQTIVLHPEAVEVAKTISAYYGPASGEDIHPTELVVHLFLQHLDSLCELIGNITQICHDDYDGSTEEFSAFLAQQLRKNETIH